MWMTSGMQVVALWMEHRGLAVLATVIAAGVVGFCAWAFITFESPFWRMAKSENAFAHCEKIIGADCREAKQEMIDAQQAYHRSVYERYRP